MTQLIAVMPIAHLAEGDHTVMRVQGQEVLICCVEGQYYAVQGRCSHAGQSLSSGHVRGCVVTCPRHGAGFDVRSGACLSAPATQPLRHFPVMLDRGKICIEV